jgi:quinol monooxygenase YgiN
MIIIHAYIKVNPNDRLVFLEQARLVTKPSQDEEGNISYHYFEDPEHPNHFIFVEKWKDEKAVQLHEETYHFKRFGNEIGKLISEPIQVELYDATVKQ